MSQASTTKIKLKFVDEKTTPVVTELEMRRPKVKDQLASKNSSNDPAHQECNLFATLCTVSLSTITNLDMADYLAVQRVYQDMEAGNA